MDLNDFLLLILALTGIAIVYNALIKRLKKEKNEPVYDPKKDDPLNQIREKLYLEIAIEKIAIGYFALVALVYLVKLIFGISLPGVSLTMLYLSGLVFFLLIYKFFMILLAVDKFFPWILLSILFSGIIFFAVLAGIEVDFWKLLIETREYNLTIHSLGLVLGLGGTFVVDIMFTHFLRNYYISARESVIMHLISQMIILGLILLILSGFALLLPDYKTFLESPRFLMKMTVVIIIIINGAALNVYVTPKMKKISLKEEDRGRHETLKKISFALGGLSIASWLSAFVLAKLKELFEMPYFYLLIGYLALLTIATVGSQVAKIYYEKKEAKEI
jgi:hypothetical protein